MHAPLALASEQSRKQARGRLSHTADAHVTSAFGTPLLPIADSSPPPCAATCTDIFAFVARARLSFTLLSFFSLKGHPARRSACVCGPWLLRRPFSYALSLFCHGPHTHWGRDTFDQPSTSTLAAGCAPLMLNVTLPRHASTGALHIRARLCRCVAFLPGPSWSWPSSPAFGSRSNFGKAGTSEALASAKPRPMQDRDPHPHVPPSTSATPI